MANGNGIDSRFTMDEEEQARNIRLKNNTPRVRNNADGLPPQLLDVFQKRPPTSVSPLSPPRGDIGSLEQRRQGGSGGGGGTAAIGERLGGDPNRSDFVRPTTNPEGLAIGRTVGEVEQRRQARDPQPLRTGSTRLFQDTGLEATGGRGPAPQTARQQETIGVIDRLIGADVVRQAQARPTEDTPRRSPGFTIIGQSAALERAARQQRRGFERQVEDIDSARRRGQISARRANQAIARVQDAQQEQLGQAANLAKAQTQAQLRQQQANQEAALEAQRLGISEITARSQAQRRAEQTALERQRFGLDVEKFGATERERQREAQRAEREFGLEQAEFGLQQQTEARRAQESILEAFNRQQQSQLRAGELTAEQQRNLQTQRRDINTALGRFTEGKGGFEQVRVAARGNPELQAIVIQSDPEAQAIQEQVINKELTREEGNRRLEILGYRFQ